jgi:hypothetical protein
MRKPFHEYSAQCRAMKHQHSVTFFGWLRCPTIAHGVRPRNIPARDRRSYSETAAPRWTAFLGPTTTFWPVESERPPHPIGPDGTGNIFKGLLAQIIKCKVEPAGHVLLHPRRDANPTRISQPFEPGGNIDPVAKISPSSTTTSPTLRPMRNSIRSAMAVPAFRRAIACCTSVALHRASTTLANSTSRQSPIVLTSLWRFLGDHLRAYRPEPEKCSCLVGTD